MHEQFLIIAVLNCSTFSKCHSLLSGFQPFESHFVKITKIYIGWLQKYSPNILRFFHYQTFYRMVNL